MHLRMIYTAPCVMFWFGQIQYVGKWEGVGPWKWRVFWGLWNGIEPIGECHCFSPPLWLPTFPPPSPSRTFVKSTANCKVHKGTSGTKFWNNTLGINAHVRYNLNVHSAVTIKNLCPSNLKVILHLFFHCPVPDRYRKKIDIRLFLSS